MYLEYSPLTELLLPYFLAIVYFSIAIWLLSSPRSGEATVVPTGFASDAERSQAQELLPQMPMPTTRRSSKPGQKPTKQSKKTLADILNQEIHQSPVEVSNV